MTDARTTQVIVEVGAQSSAPPARVTQTTAVLALIGAPEVRLTQDLAEAVTQAAAAPVLVTQMSVQVLVSWRVKQMFQAVWVE